MPAPLENKNAAKPAASRRAAILAVRITAAERRVMVRAAARAGLTLAAWARYTLTSAAR